jgi:hypothetical protein
LTQRTPIYTIVVHREGATLLAGGELLPQSHMIAQVIDESGVDWSGGGIPETAVVFQSSPSSRLQAMGEVTRYCEEQLRIDALGLPVKDERGQPVNLGRE